MMQNKERKKKKFTLEKKNYFAETQKMWGKKTFCYSQTLKLVTIVSVCLDTHEIWEPIGQAFVCVCMHASL